MMQLASVAPSQLVLGFLWYAYQYYCRNGTIDWAAGKCTPAEATHVDYDFIVALLAGQNAGYVNVSAVRYVTNAVSTRTDARRGGWSSHRGLARAENSTSPSSSGSRRG